jgi:hypothetical protein
VTIAQQAVTYDVAAAKVYPMLSDLVGGGSPTYGAGVTLQGIAACTFDPNIVSAELKGDNGKVIARHGRADRFTCQLTYGRLGLDAIAVMLGGQVVNNNPGAGNETQAWTLPGLNTLPFFRIEVQITDLDNGILDCHLVGWKGQLKSATFVDSKTDAFGQPKIDLEAITTLGAFQPYGAISNVPQMASIVFFSTQTALA